MKIDNSRDALLTQQAKDLLSEFYMKEGESYQEALARPAMAFCGDDKELGQRIYDYASMGWMMYSSPILSNAPKGGEKAIAMPISCYLSYVPDDIKGQIEAASELAHLSISGGGVGMHNGIRAVSKKAPGAIPYMKTLDAAIGYYKQSSSPKGSVAYYLDVDHPDIVEFIRFRVPTGGDVARKADNRRNFHHGVNITKEFMEKVRKGEEYYLRCPKKGNIEKVKARDVWEGILETRVLTGEPYLHFIDVSREKMPQSMKDAGLTIHGSNLCNEITLPTSEDRTAVCCLSSLNIEKYDEWKDSTIVEDMITFLDNVLEYFIQNAPEAMSKAVYSAKSERSLGLGVMGFHGLLMKKGIRFDSGGFRSAAQLNYMIFKDIKEKALRASKRLGEERGVPKDARGVRNCHLLAIAPTANSSTLCNCTPSIEPINSNAYTHTTRSGTYLVKNPILDEVLKEKGTEEEREEWWRMIIEDEGSVRSLECLTDDEKEVFKTAWEIDQHWIVELAAGRQEHICQSQSVNLYFPSNSDREYVNSVHLKASEGKLKGLYYLRTTRKSKVDIAKSEECLSCQ